MHRNVTIGLSAFRRSVPHPVLGATRPPAPPRPLCAGLYGGFCGSIRSTYFAMMSNSTFTIPLGWRLSKFVRRRVCGMSQTTKLAGSTSAIVRLTPFSATEPWLAT